MVSDLVGQDRRQLGLRLQQGQQAAADVDVARAADDRREAGVVGNREAQARAVRMIGAQQAVADPLHVLLQALVRIGAVTARERDIQRRKCGARRVRRSRSGAGGEEQGQADGNPADSARGPGGG